MKNQNKIVKKCLKGDLRAQNELYKQLYNTLMNVSSRYFKNEHDVLTATNSAFLKILEKLDRFDTNREFEPWAARSAINSICDEFRRTKNVIKLTDGDAVEDYQMGHEQNEIEEEVQSEDLRNMLTTLPATTNRVFNLFALDGYNHKEIAERLEITEGTSRWHLAEARKRLKDLLNQRQTAQKKTLIYEA